MICTDLKPYLDDHSESKKNLHSGHSCDVTGAERSDDRTQ
jgi:hypothetical protein